MAPGRRQDADPVLAELRQIKALLILLLIKAGTDSFEVARVTGIGSSTIRRDFLAKQVAPFARSSTRVQS